MFQYLVKSEGPDRVGGQLHRVKQSDLDQAVGLCATCWPVLIALHLKWKRGEAVRDEEKVEYFFAKILVKEKRKKRADVTSSACVEGTKKKKRRGRGVLKQISERI